MFELPIEFQNRMRSLLGEAEYAEFASSYERERSRGLRLNPLKLPKNWARDVKAADGAMASAEAQGQQVPDFLQKYRAHPIPWAQTWGFYYPEEDRPGKSPLHEAGLYYLQEPSAMSVAALADAQPGEKVLDLCAAPGGKSTMLAAALAGRGLLISNEIHPQRAKILSQNIERMGVTNGIVTNESADRLAGRFPSFFDKVVVDAPCSGEGMFRKEEQALTCWSVENVESCAERQAEILDCAAGMVKSGGELIYSTCTFAPEEDEETIATFCMRHPEFHIVDVPGRLGSRMAEYGFACGRPEWCEENDETPEEEQQANRQMEREKAPDVGRTIRLWPHRLEGEGHYAAVLVKEGTHISEPLPELAEDLFFTSFAEDARDTKSNTRPNKRRGQSCSSGSASLRKNAGRGFSERDAVDGGRRGAKGKGRYQNEYHNGYQDRHQGVSDWEDSNRKNLPCSNAELLAAAEDFLKETLQDHVLYSIAAKCGGVPKRFGEDLYLMPYGAQIETDGLRILRPGLWLGTVKKGRFEPAHSLAMALHPEEVRQVLDVPADSREAAAFLRGESLPCDPAQKGWVLVTIDGVSIGWGKASGGMLRNHYPKGLRRP